jgi:hypothetical protein
MEGPFRTSVACLGGPERGDDKSMISKTDREFRRYAGVRELRSKNVKKVKRRTQVGSENQDKGGGPGYIREARDPGFRDEGRGSNMEVVGERGGRPRSFHPPCGLSSR